MIKFEIVEAYKGKIDESYIPVRSTKKSAGYDIRAAEDVVIPSMFTINNNLLKMEEEIEDEHGQEPFTLDQIDNIIKTYSSRATLIPTGIKAYFPEDTMLSIRSRSSMPYKHFLIVGNGPATIDSDYVDNPQNEGHISVMLINLSIYDIIIKKGEKIAQFVFEPFYKTSGEEEILSERLGGYGSTGK